MKKQTRRAFTLLLTLIMLLSCILTAHAAQPESDNTSPMYAVPIFVDCIGNVSSDLTLSILCEYSASASAGVTRVDITAYVEKRTLLLKWERVDIDRPNDEWTTICYGVENDSY